MPRLPNQDIEHVLRETAQKWEFLRGKRIFLTGGTGFFGRWLLETFIAANREWGLGAQMVILSRNPSAFLEKSPYLRGTESIKWVQGRIAEFTPEDVVGQLGEGKQHFNAVIHLVTESDGAATASAPLAALETIVGGTKRALEFSRAAGAERFLFTSSGAVYGRQPPDLSHIPETYLGGPDFLDTSAAYGTGGEAKRYAELLCSAFAHQHGLGAIIARCFSFIGPYLPLNAKFAAGNFLADALEGRPLSIKGDGTPLRSFLYAADLAVWLWTLLFAGEKARVYNVGSEVPVSIRELAEVVALVCGRPGQIVTQRQPQVGALPERYIPSTKRAADELGLREKIGLEESVRRTLHWHESAARH